MDFGYVRATRWPTPMDFGYVRATPEVLHLTRRDSSNVSQVGICAKGEHIDMHNDENPPWLAHEGCCSLYHTHSLHVRGNTVQKWRLSHAAVSHINMNHQFPWTCGTLRHPFGFVCHEKGTELLSSPPTLIHTLQHSYDVECTANAARRARTPSLLNSNPASPYNMRRERTSMMACAARFASQL